MFRLAPYKNNSLSEVEIKLTMSMTTEENGKLTDKFFNLELEYAKITGLSLSWTIVHPIDDKSPFFGLSKEDIANTDMEIMVFLKGFDQIFSNNVVTRTSYVNSEIIWGAKFNMMFHPNENMNKTILHLDKINDFDLVPLPESATIAAAN